MCDLKITILSNYRNVVMFDYIIIFFVSVNYLYAGIKI